MRGHGFDRLWEALLAAVVAAVLVSSADAQPVAPPAPTVEPTTATISRTVTANGDVVSVTADYQCLDMSGCMVFLYRPVPDDDSDPHLDIELAYEDYPWEPVVGSIAIVGLDEGANIWPRTYRLEIWNATRDPVLGYELMMTIEFADVMPGESRVGATVYED